MTGDVGITTLDVDEDTSALDPAMLATLVETVAQVDGLARRLQRVVRAGPAKGSRAASDLKNPEGRFVLVFATQALGFAVDHLRSWQLLVFGGLHPTFAQMTLVRAGLEGAVTARWLVDPRVAPDIRVARGVAAALDDYEERAKFERSANITPPPDGDTAKSAAARIEELKANREAAGLPVVRYPSTTWLMGEFGGIDSDGIWLYRLVSAFAHAKQWSLAGTDRTPRRQSHLMSGVEGGTVTASDQIVLFATLRAFGLVEAALAEIEEYCRSPSRPDRLIKRWRSPRRE